MHTRHTSEPVPEPRPPSQIEPEGPASAPWPQPMRILPHTPRRLRSSGLRLSTTLCTVLSTALCTALCTVLSTAFFTVLSAQLLTGCQSTAGVEVKSAPAPITQESVMQADANQDPAPRADEKDTPPGFVVKMTEGMPEGDAYVKPVVPPATLLTDSATRQLLNRMPAMEGKGDDVQDFKVRESSLPPPRPGNTVTSVFPPPIAPDAPAVKSGPLTVERYSPEGEVPLAPHLSITYSQPMVAVTSHEALDNPQTRPARLTPEPPGKWRWVGTQTLLFEPDVRFPMATEYTVEIPAGTTSATGSKLDKAVSWKFGTPAPIPQQFQPTSTPQPLSPVMFISFDQKIVESSVLESLTVNAAGQTYTLRQATAEEIKADATVHYLTQQAEPGRWLAFKTTSPLPVDTPVAILLKAGVQSQEGPRRTTSTPAWSFNTYGPLVLREGRCGWGQCMPLTPWQLNFSNPLDAKAFKKEWVKVSPELPDMKVSASGFSIQISGKSKGNTSYSVTVAGDLKDTFGQTMGRTASHTFKVGRSAPWLTSQGGNYVLLDPYGPPVFPVYTINQPKLNVQLFRVKPSDFEAFRLYMREQYRVSDPPPIPGQRIASTLAPKGEADELIETPIDLTPALINGVGQVIVVVEPTNQPKDVYNRQRVVAWAQVSQLGLDAFSDQESLQAWVTRLKDGAPVPEASVSLLDIKGEVRTNAAGTADVPLPDAGAVGKILLARSGDDTFMLPWDISWWYDGYGWSKRPTNDSLRWYVFDDRKMYKPGENIKLKGWLRLIEGRKGGDIALPPTLTQLNYVLRDSMGNEISRGTAPVSSTFGFDLSLDLPGTMNLGNAYLELNTGLGISGYSYSHSFQVQEFRRPEFEVSTSPSPGPFFLHGTGTVTVAARYYAGGGLPGAETQWTLRSRPGSFSPPNHSDFTFGTWIPWWRSMSDFDGGEAYHQQLNVKTNATGDHTVKLDFQSVWPPRPTSVILEASVSDVNRQRWTSQSTLLVHASSLYVGLKNDKTFVQKGEALNFDTVVTDVDGKRVSGAKVVVTAFRQDWVQEEGEWLMKEVGQQTCNLISDTNPAPCVIRPDEGGSWIIRAYVRDPQGRLNQTELTRWVTGGKQPPSRGVQQEEVQLIPDKQTYKPGDVAQVLVMSPFAPAEGVMRLTRNGILTSERFSLSQGSTTLKIPVDDTMLPEVTLEVNVNGKTARSGADGMPDPGLTPRPAYGAGSLTLKVSPLSRQLRVEVSTADKALSPGGNTQVTVEVKDASNLPVNSAEVAIVAVDEAVLALTGYKLDDPMDIFYAARGSNTSARLGRENLLLAAATSLGTPPAAPEGMPGRAMMKMGASGGAVPPPSPMAAAPIMADAPMEMSKAAPARERRAKTELKDSENEITGSLDEGGGGNAHEPIAVRSNFNPLALFAPAVTTDGRGQASVALKLPDNLTRYRIMAVAVSGEKKFGMGEASLVARLPLMMRPSPPRFLNFGDKSELPIVLQNQTDAPLSVQLAVRASNAILSNGAGKQVTVPPNDRVEVRFPIAADKPGTARFQIGASAGSFADAANVSFPVYTPATSEAFATYGQIDSGAIAQPIHPPENVFPQFGGLEITTSSTSLQGLTDAMLYLVSYPFDCAEQISSRVLGIAALQDVLTAFGAEGMPSPDELKVRVKADLERLSRMQNPDGGFAFWRWGSPSWPYLSVHVAHALARAKEKGYEVPSNMLARSLSHLQSIENYIPSDYSAEARREIIAYALYVRMRLGDLDPKKSRALVQEAGLEKTPLESLGFVLQIFAKSPGYEADVKAILRVLKNRVSETASTAAFSESISDGALVLLHSNRRTDGILLEALITAEPSSDLIPKLVNGLLAHRKAGRWLNTQENVFILLAMDAYFRTYENVTPDFMARVWLGDRFAGEHAFKGYNTDRARIDIPMRWIQDPKNVNAKQDPNLIVSKEGAGRLYYRIGMRYAPTNLSLEPVDHGFTVERTYEAVDKPEDVKKDKEGVWHIKAGAKVKVKLTMVAKSRRYHVALVDPLPAGLEPLNPALKTTETLPNESSQMGVIGASGFGGPGRGMKWGWWWGNWYEHENLRDERVEAFTSLLWEGVHTYTYFARATTPGQYVVPPTKAEEMYMPETFGRASSEKVIVED